MYLLFSITQRVVHFKRWIQFAVRISSSPRWCTRPRCTGRCIFVVPMSVCSLESVKNRVLEFRLTIVRDFKITADPAPGTLLYFSNFSSCPTVFSISSFHSPFFARISNKLRGVIRLTVKIRTVELTSRQSRGKKKTLCKNLLRTCITHTIIVLLSQRIFPVSHISAYSFFIFIFYIL